MSSFTLSVYQNDGAPIHRTRANFPRRGPQLRPRVVSRLGDITPPRTRNDPARRRRRIGITAAVSRISANSSRARRGRRHPRVVCGRIGCQDMRAETLRRRFRRPVDTSTTYPSPFTILSMVLNSNGTCAPKTLANYAHFELCPRDTFGSYNNRRGKRQTVRPTKRRPPQSPKYPTVNASGVDISDLYRTVPTRPRLDTRAAENVNATMARRTRIIVFHERRNVG